MVLAREQRKQNKENRTQNKNMKEHVIRTASLVAMVGLCAGVAQASIVTETIVVSQQSVSEGAAAPVTTDLSLDFIGGQFNSALGTLNSVSLSLTANLSGSTVGAVRIAPGSDSWPISWNYAGNVTLSTVPLSSTWSGKGSTSVNPQPSSQFQFFSIGLSDPASTSTVLTSGLSQFIGNSTFDLGALLEATASWGSTPNNGTEFGNFDPTAGATLQVTYNYSAVPEPTTVVAGGMLLLPFGACALRLLRRKQTA
jgi:hypothetical protein